MKILISFVSKHVMFNIIIAVNHSPVKFKKNCAIVTLISFCLQNKKR